MFTTAVIISLQWSTNDGKFIVNSTDYLWLWMCNERKNTYFITATYILYSKWVQNSPRARQVGRRQVSKLLLFRWQWLWSEQFTRLTPKANFMTSRPLNQILQPAVTSFCSRTFYLTTLTTYIHYLPFLTYIQQITTFQGLSNEKFTLLCHTSLVAVPLWLPLSPKWPLKPTEPVSIPVAASHTLCSHDNAQMQL